MSSPAQTSPVEAQPLIAVRDVRASSRWYAALLGADTLPDHPHRDVYDRIWRSGRLLLQLHAWDAEEHPNLVDADAAPHGHGVLLWFQVGDFDAAVERARGLKAEIIEGPLFNPAPGHSRDFGFGTRTATSLCSPARTVKAAPNRTGCACNDDVVPKSSPACRLRSHPMFDHIMLRTQQFDAMTAFYEKALAPLGIKKLMAFDKAAGFGRDKPGLWISASSSRARASIWRCRVRTSPPSARFTRRPCGGREDNGAPGPRDFAPNYYAAFVIDPDGNNIEAANRGA